MIQGGRNAQKQRTRQERRHGRQGQGPPEGSRWCPQRQSGDQGTRSRRSGEGRGPQEEGPRQGSVQVGGRTMKLKQMVPSGKQLRSAKKMFGVAKDTGVLDKLKPSRNGDDEE